MRIPIKAPCQKSPEPPPSKRAQSLSAWRLENQSNLLGFPGHSQEKASTAARLEDPGRGSTPAEEARCMASLYMNLSIHQRHAGDSIGSRLGWSFETPKEKCCRSEKLFSFYFSFPPFPQSCPPPLYFQQRDPILCWRGFSIKSSGERDFFRMAVGVLSNQPRPFPVLFWVPEPPTHPSFLSPLW